MAGTLCPRCQPSHMSVCTSSSSSSSSRSRCRQPEQQQQKQQQRHLQAQWTPHRPSELRCGRTRMLAVNGQPQQPGELQPPEQPLYQQAVLGLQPPPPVLPHLGAPVQPRPPHPALAWLPPQVAVHMQALGRFLVACWQLLPEFVSPSLPEALRRLGLVLCASLAMIVVVSTIDSGWLCLHLMNARQGVVVGA